MYKIEFGEVTKHTAYIYEVDADGFFLRNEETQYGRWYTGSKQAFQMIFDSVGGSEYMPGEIVKTSVKVKLIREEENDFLDIIAGGDNSWRLLITNGDTELRSTYSSLYEKYYPTLASSGDHDIAFYGMLTDEQYREEYRHNPTVELTFHDRLGELSEVEFIPETQYMSLSALLYELLNGLPCAHNLLIEFPYKYNYGSSLGISITPDIYYIDVSIFYAKKRDEVLREVLKCHGLSLFTDYSVVVGNDVGECATTRIWHLGNIGKTTNTSYTLTDDGDKYVIGDDEVATKVLKEIPNIFTLEAGAQFSLVRKLKHLDATNKLEIAESIFYPATLTEEFFIPIDSVTFYPIYDKDDYDNITDRYSLYGDIFLMLKDDSSAYYVPIAKVGSSNKVGVFMIDTSWSSSELKRIVSRRGMIIKGTNTMKLSLEVYSQSTRNIYYSIAAYSPVYDTYKQYDHSTKTWSSYPAYSGWPTDNLAFEATAKEYTSGTFADIPQPDFADGLIYICVVVRVAAFSGVLACHLTECKLVIENPRGLPPSLTVRTNISDTRRSGATEEFKLYTLPEIDGDQSLFNGGVYIYHDAISSLFAPEKIIYNTGYASLLVHASDIIGQQMTADRWLFDAVIHDVASNTLAIVTAEWSDYVCEKVSSENNGYMRAVYLRVIKIDDGEQTSNNLYTITDAIPDTSFTSITQDQLAALSLEDYASRLAAFREYVSTQESVENIISYEINEARGYSTIACPYTAAEDYNVAIFLQWTDSSVYSNDGLGGSFVVLNGSDELLVRVHVLQYSKEYAYYYVVDGGTTAKIDLSGLLGYISAAPVTIYKRWKIDDGEWQSSDPTSAITSRCIVTVQVQTTPF